MARYQSFFDNAGNELTFVEALELCRASYRDLRSTPTITIAGTEVRVEHYCIWDLLGFAAFIIQKPGGWRAMVFRGSDDVSDWVLNNIPGYFSPIPPPQYVLAEGYAAQQHHTVLVGHSLGGGVAAYAAAKRGQAAATIFPAPFPPTWLGFPFVPWFGSKIQNYVCNLEILTMSVSVVPPRLRYGNDVHIESRGDNPIERHYFHNIVL